MNLAELGLAFDQVPIVFQYNKRDIRNILPIEKLNETLNPEGLPIFEAAALHGIGVFETLKAHLAAGHRLGAEEVAPGGAGAARAGGSRGAGADTGATPAAAKPVRDAPAAATRPRTRPCPRARGRTRTRWRHWWARTSPRWSSRRRTPTNTCVPVTTKGQVDIQQELEKLRTLAGDARAPPRPRPGPGRSTAASRTCSARTRATRQDVKRKATLEVPGELLKGTDTLRDPGLLRQRRRRG